MCTALQCGIAHSVRSCRHRCAALRHSDREQPRTHGMGRVACTGDRRMASGGERMLNADGGGGGRPLAGAARGVSSRERGGAESLTRREDAVRPSLHEHDLES